MPLLTSPLAATLLAADGGGAGGSGFLPIVLLAAVVVFFFVLPMRRQKKMREDLKQRQEQMGPGTRVMTQFGLFGTIVSTDPLENTAVLRIAPDTDVTVYLPAVTTVLDENGRIPGSPEAARAAAAATEAPASPAEGEDLQYDPSRRTEDEARPTAEHDEAAAGRTAPRPEYGQREDELPAEDGTPRRTTLNGHDLDERGRDEQDTDRGSGTVR